MGLGPGVQNWHKIVTCIIMLLLFNIFSWKQLIYLKGHPQCHHLIWSQGNKNLNFQTFQWIGENSEIQSRIFKNPNFLSLLWIWKNLKIYTAPDQHFKIPMLNLWMSWENLSFPVENKTENSHKREWSNFKLKINDSDIPFPNMLRICQLIVKNHFHWRKWTEPIKSITQCVRLKIKM